MGYIKDFNRLGDPHFFCIVCAMGTRIYDADFRYEREDWEILFKKRKRKSVFIPSTELEATDFKKDPNVWTLFYRTILDDPKTNVLSISGIAAGWAILSHPILAPTDPKKACICRIMTKENHWNADFRMANIFGRDKHRQAGKRVGYPVHAHCWLLLDRIIGIDTVQQNLRVFIQTVKMFWRQQGKGSYVEIDHDGDENCWYEPDSLALRRQDATTANGSPEPDEQHLPPWEQHPVTHWPASPFRVPAIQDLIARVQQECTTRPSLKLNSSVTRLPREVAVMVVDTIYQSRPFCRSRVEDTRNLLEAFQWTLPSTYWIARCNPDLVFEVQDLASSGKIVDWAGLCLGLEELLLNPNWYCNSGLNHRRRTLGFLAGIKKQFLERINGCNGE